MIDLCVESVIIRPVDRWMINICLESEVHFETGGILDRYPKQILSSWISDEKGIDFSVVRRLVIPSILGGLRVCIESDHVRIELPRSFTLYSKQGPSAVDDQIVFIVVSEWE